MNLLTFTLEHIDLFLVVLTRMVGFLITAPLFGQSVFPAWTKIGLAGSVALLLESNLTLPGSTLPTLPGLAVLVAQEAAVGLLLGWLANLLYAAVSVGGRFLDVEIGLNVAPVLYGTDGFASSAIEGFQSALFALYFLGMNGLDGLVLAMLDSYRYIPIGQFNVSHWSMHFVTGLALAMFTLAVEFVIPLVCTMLLADTTMAILARAIPSMNVLFVGLPAKIWVGLTMLSVGMGSSVYVFGQVFNQVFNAMSQFLQGWGG